MTDENKTSQKTWTINTPEHVETVSAETFDVVDSGLLTFLNFGDSTTGEVVAVFGPGMWSYVVPAGEKTQEVIPYRATATGQGPCPTCGENTYYDENTLTKVYTALATRLADVEATEMIDTMQNRGILFRERS